jgi:hypothetical protein
VVKAQGDFLSGQVLAEPDLPPGGEHVAAGGHGPVDLHSIGDGGDARLRGRRVRGYCGQRGQAGWQPQRQVLALLSGGRLGEAAGGRVLHADTDACLASLDPLRIGFG